MVLVDTSALYALLVDSDEGHGRAQSAFADLQRSGEAMLATSYVLQETIALLQVRVGMAAVRDLHERILPLLVVEWIGERIHDLAMSALIASNTRKISLADRTSFQVMRARGVETAFTFDLHFRKHGFRTLP